MSAVHMMPLPTCMTGGRSMLSTLSSASSSCLMHFGIENKREQAVKLLSRHWIITDDNNKVEEVRGSGVLGQQPMIAPGQVFHYTSGAVLTTGFGTMQGSYEMLSADGETFAAPIPAFLLSRPLSVH